MTTAPDSGLKPLLLPPRLRTVEEGDGRRASNLELFFDLVFVVAIAQLAHELGVDHSLRGFAVFAALYLPVFLAWQGFSFYADRFDTDDVVFRVVMFTAMLAIAALAIQIPDVAHGESTGFVIAYLVLRSLMVGLYLRSYRHVPEARPLIARYASEYSLAIGIWALSLAFASPTRYALWGIALAWELSIPTLARKLFTAIPVHGSHVPERFALFTIIVLGETIVVVALGTSGSDWARSSAVVASLGFAAAAAIWWVYFGGGGEVTLRRSPAAILVFTHVHIPLLAALTAFSAGVALVIEQAADPSLDTGTRWALAGGAALYLACVTTAQRATDQGLLRGTERARAVAVGVLVVLALAGGELEPPLFVALVAATLVLLVAHKLWSAQRFLRGA
ncbi:MAG TPA: low temperature requirement protein A [Gaiellaceae bacterium]|nr:low temperature requirement protein A [Gaiellaceae bacterium]